jgi:hypothetical protein
MKGLTAVAQQSATSKAATNGAALERKCACGQHTVTGVCEACAGERGVLQRRASGSAAGPYAPAEVHRVLEGGGRPLDGETRAYMESRFAHDFSSVRVHADANAADSARAVGALAYTVGRNVVFDTARYAPRTGEGRKLLAHELAHVIQQEKGTGAAVQPRTAIAPASHPLEAEADRAADRVAAGQAPVALGSTGPIVQRTEDPAAGGGQTAAAPHRDLIVDDDAHEIGAGQMRKSEFLQGLRTHVCAVADRVLAQSGRTAQGCPLIEHWITRMQSRRAVEVERSIRRYAPESTSAATAREYYATVGERVRQGVARWAQTGDLRGVPPELMAEMGGGGLSAVLGGLMGGIGAAISSIGRLFGKAREGGLRQMDPAAVQARLDGGSPLEGGVQSRMEGAFGAAFGGVRIHTGSRAAALASAANATAFTLGRDVVFAPGEYAPGTPIGDALLAHELAHVAQQQRTATLPAPDGELERDADSAAVDAMTSLWGTEGKRRRTAMPRVASGLRLQRCGMFGPSLRKPEEVQQEFKAIRREALASISDDIQRNRYDGTFGDLEMNYENTVSAAGGDTRAQAQAQEDLIAEAKRLRESCALEVEMNKRWGITFAVGLAGLNPDPSQPSKTFTIRVWSADELRIVDGLLRQAPPGSLRHVTKIERAPFKSVASPDSVPAATVRKFTTVYLYDMFFTSRNSEQQRADFLHELGHAGEESRNENTFQSLPSKTWMEISDWRTATSATFAAEMGISADMSLKEQDRVDSSKKPMQGFARPIKVGKRMVVRDQYEKGLQLRQYVHYNPAYQEEFVSDYATAHPADDLAESYSWVLREPKIAKGKLDRPHSGKVNKWQYVQNRLAEDAKQADSPKDTPLVPKLRDGGQQDAAERDADRAAEQATRRHGLIAEDDAVTLGPGQMRKTGFLEALQARASAAAEPGLARRGQTSRGCPVIARWIARMRTLSGAEVESRIRRYAPEASAAQSAREYLALVGERVRQGVARWAATGDTSAAPPEMLAEVSGGGLGAVLEAVTGGIRTAVSAIGGLFGKARGGGLDGTDPAAVSGRLRGGATLEPGVRGRMEVAFGRSFGGVRVHTGPEAARMASELNARAFTVGSDVAFDSGEYRPGTAIGDALIAHELAHVAQQAGAEAAAAVHPGLESDADRAAARALAGERPAPHRRSGLSLQRCGRSREGASGPVPSLEELKAKSAFQLAAINPEAFSQAPAADPEIARQYADFARAAKFARWGYEFAGVKYDAELDLRPVGRPAEGDELKAIDAQLGRLLAAPGIAKAATAKSLRDVPKGGAPAQPTAKGHARIVDDPAEFAVKNFQLLWLVGEMGKVPSPNFDAKLLAECKARGIPVGDQPTITDQERRVGILLQGKLAAPEGFYFPPEDTFYLPSQSAGLKTPHSQVVARHELVHMLGGRDVTRKAFVSRFGVAHYLNYWNTFEEGMAEVISKEAAPEMPEGEIAYPRQFKLMNQLMAEPGMSRDILYQQYLTGRISDQVFQFLEREVH